MDVHKSETDIIPFRSPEVTFTSLDAEASAEVAAAAGDITLIVDDEGVVRDIAFGDAKLAKLDFGAWLDKPWIDTVASESRVKVEQMLNAASSGGRVRWRHVNHSLNNDDVPIKYITLGAGKVGWFIAIGRDLRATAALQQRLLQTQQSMERDYIRLRQSESRYRMLFDESSEAVLIVDTPTRRITEANPATLALIGEGEGSIIGRPVASLFDADDRDRVIAMLGSVAAAEQIDSVDLRLASGARDCKVATTLFRQGRGSFFLIRLVPTGESAAVELSPDRRLIEVLERVPDAFVVTDESLNIITENAAFLEMTQFARKEQVRGQPLGRFLGRPGIDLNLLVAQLREHGSVSNFATIMRGRYDSQDEVELSAVAVLSGAEPCFGFTIRVVGRARDQNPAMNGVTRSVEQLTELVGRVSLKEIVRESTDLIERLCIEAALNFTSDNRASAAEILGLSRQSLYSKLHRHGIATANMDGDSPA